MVISRSWVQNLMDGGVGKEPSTAPGVAMKI